MEGAGRWVAGYAGDRLRTHTFIGFDFPETMFLTGDRTALHLHWTALSAGVLLCALLLLSRPARTPLLALGVAGINLAAMTFLMGPSPGRIRPAPPFPGPAAGGVVADVSVGREVLVRLMHPVWWTRIGRIDVRDGRPPAPGVCTVLVSLPGGTSPEASWPAHPAGWRPYPRRDRPNGWVVWRAPACPAAQ